MPVQTVAVTMDVPKELKDIIDLLDAIVEKVVAKESLTTFTELLDEFVTAMTGIGAVGDEIKSEYRDEALAYLVHKLGARLFPVETTA